MITSYLNSKTNTIGAFLIFALLLTGCTLKRENTGEENKAAKKAQAESRLYLAKGVELFKSGEIAKGILLFEKAISLDPNNETAYQLTVSAYIQNKQQAKAVRLLTPLLEKFPNNSTFPYVLAITYKQSGQLEQAYTAAQRAVTINEAWQKKEELQQSQALLFALTKEIQTKTN